MELMDYAFYKAMNKNGGGGSGGGDSGEATSKDVNFIDYDGTIVYSYTAAEFARLTAMPDNPSHEGLTAQGWNWSLSDAQSYVASYGTLTIGQMYITSDGKTRIYIRLGEGRLEPYLGICVSGTAIVDWGDGTTSTVTGTDTIAVVNTQHTYSTAGNYVITIAMKGSLGFIGISYSGSQVLWKNQDSNYLNHVYHNAIQKVELGDGVTRIRNYAFYHCSSLQSITIPKNVIDIEGSVFNFCYSLQSITIPESVTRTSYSMFSGCNSLQSVAIPESVISTDNSTFNNCYSLQSINIPRNVTSIGNKMLSNCYSLQSITIPENVTDIGASAFNFCYGIGFIKFAGSTPPTVENKNAWATIPTDCKIYVPAGSLEAYTTATNYPNSNTYTYVEY